MNKKRKLSDLEGDELRKARIHLELKAIKGDYIKPKNKQDNNTFSIMQLTRHPIKLEDVIYKEENGKVEFLYSLLIVPPYNNLYLEEIKGLIKKINEKLKNQENKGI